MFARIWCWILGHAFTEEDLFWDSILTGEDVYSSKEHDTCLRCGAIKTPEYQEKGDALFV